MGMIRMTTMGSFGSKSFEASAQEHGHAQAVAEAIRWLSTEVLPAAIERDHALQRDGHLPNDQGFRPFKS